MPNSSVIEGMDYTGKYFFISNVRTDDDNVVSQILGYDTRDEAEIKFHDEVSYGLKLTNVVLAHYEVRNEYGVTVSNLIRTIDHVPDPAPVIVE